MKKLVFLAVLLVFVGSACAADITTGLVGWWKMDGQTDPGNAKLVKDYSGFGNDGSMGSTDVWAPGGGISFTASGLYGGWYGETGVTFPSKGADLVADMGLDKTFTVSYAIQLDDIAYGGHYAFDGRNSSHVRVLSSEFPTGKHFLNLYGTNAAWGYEAFNDTDSRFIYTNNGVGKAWGDWITITETVDFNAGDYKLYVDGILYHQQTGISGSVADLAEFYIARRDDSGGAMKGRMQDFRIYNRALSADDVATLVPEPATIALLGLGALTLIKRKRS